MTDESFYVVLPSNAEGRNTPSHFHTTLQRPIQIEQPTEWEVGLVDVNLKMSLHMNHKDRIRVKHIEKTSVSSENEIELEFKTLLESNIRKPYQESKVYTTTLSPDDKVAVEVFDSYLVGDGTKIQQNSDESMEEVYFKYEYGRVHLV